MLNNAALTHENATHVLMCRHCIGAHRTEYTMRCHIIKELPDNRVKILVFGERYWPDRLHIKNIRYVDKERVYVK